MMKKKQSLRIAYGETLVELGHQDPDFFVLDADLSTSTQTILFKNVFAERHINMGIAESNMCLFAAGLAKTVKTVFVSTFAMFLSGRAWEEIRNSIAYDRANVKLVATHAGISVGEDGSSHQANEDMALMKLIPQMQVFAPADYYETKAIIRYVHAISEPVYIRLSRETVIDVFDDGYQWQPEEPVGIRCFEQSRILIFSTGIMTGIVKEAMEQLETILQQQFSFYHLPQLKPLKKDSFLDLVKNHCCALSFEEHSVIGGLGDTLLSLFQPEDCLPIYKYGIMDTFGKSGKSDQLFDYFNLSVEKVKQEMIKHIQNYIS